MTLLKAVEKAIKDCPIGEHPMALYPKLPHPENFPEATPEEIGDAAGLIIAHAQKLQDHWELKLV